MKRFKNPNSLPVAPAVWKDPHNGHREEFRPATQPFDAFLSRVWDYWDRNHVDQPRPTREAIENELCGQWPSIWCVGENYHAPVRVSTTARAGGCKTCKKRV